MCRHGSDGGSLSGVVSTRLAAQKRKKSPLNDPQVHSVFDDGKLVVAHSNIGGGVPSTLRLKNRADKIHEHL
jgi:hypothetical protein